MFSTGMRRIYKRLMILGLLSMCLLYFGYLEETQSVGAAAAPCIQDCEASENMCQDSCATSCSADSTDAECSTCFQNCSSQFQSCMSHAVFCRNADEPPEPNCQVGFADHCPVINGAANCSDPSTHSGYYSICTTIGNQQCVNCPDHQYCQGANGLPSCF